MKDIRGIKGKYYIARLIEEGEHEHQDFKFAISDARKIARSISAFANNDGGRLLVGVKDNGVIAGIRNEEHIYVVEQAAGMYCSPPQEIHVTAFRTDGDKTVLRIEIDRAASRPVMVIEADGTRHAFYRVRDENILAPQLMLRAWREASSEKEGTLIALTDAGRSLMAMISERAVSVEEFMLAAKVSRSHAEDTVVRLHSMGLLDFVYDGHVFLLTAK